MNDFDDDDPRTIVLEAYPGAKPFVDLITSDTIEDFTAVARELDRKVKNLPENQTQQPSSDRSTPRNPNTKTVKTVKESVDTRDWSSFLSASWQAQQADRDDDRG